MNALAAVVPSTLAVTMQAAVYLKYGAPEDGVLGS